MQTINQTRKVVYKITNTLRQKAYIGKTNKPAWLRFEEHMSGTGGASKLLAAIIEYGRENFIIEILDTAVSDEDLALKEEKYIRQFDTVKSGYNGTYRSIGGGISAKARWNNLTPEQKSEELSHVNHVRWKNASEDDRKKVGESMKAGWNEKDRSAVVRNSWAALTPDQKALRVKNMRSYWDKLSPEERSDHARNANRKLTPEQLSKRGKKAARQSAINRSKK